ncbi:MAG: urease accessory UreF family protein [Alphaproteobacteria bacterium]
MPNDSALLLALQHGDSLFPSGGSSFSWGLEPAHRDGLVRGAADVTAFVRAQICGRFQPFDRPLLCAAHAGADDAGLLRRLDDTAEAMTLAAELREGSRKAGAALLTIHTRLATAGAGDVYEAVRAGRMHGHLPVVQGVVWRGVGLDADAASALALHGLVAGILGAALRLSLVGHAVAQSVRLALQPEMQLALAQTPCGVEDVSSFAPLAEIAAMRHPDQTMRLFAT